MGATKRYFSEQFRVNKLTLYHDEAEDFYVSCWQSGDSPIPLLCVRLVVFLGCVGILAASMALTVNVMDLSFWPIYMTHWGVFMIALTSGLAVLVSVMATLKGSVDTEYGLPWYVRLYWMTYVITVPAAFFITVFYYALLAGLDEEFSVNPVLDLFIHGMNSVMMLCLLVSAQQPVYLLQFVYLFGFFIIYMIFSIVYYYTGGLNPMGDSFIYPMLDWANPGPTVIVVLGSTAFLLIVHAVVMCLTSLRDFLTRKIVPRKNSLPISY